MKNNNKKRKAEVHQAKLRVVNPQGVHLRAAGEIVKLAAKYDTDITLSYKGEKASGKSLMSIISLALPHKGVFVVRAEGPDAKSFIEAFTKLVEDGFGELE